MSANPIRVQFDNSMAMPFDANDISAVIIDKNPEPKDLVIGVQVIAERENRTQEETSYVEGKVIQNKEKNGEKQYLVDFWDGVKDWNTLDKIRILTTIKPGGNCFSLCL